MALSPVKLQSNPGDPGSPLGRAASFPVSPVAPVSRQPGSTTSLPPSPPAAEETALSSSNGTDSVALSQSALEAAEAGFAPSLLSTADQFTPATATAPEAEPFTSSAETPQSAGSQIGVAPSINAVPPPVNSTASNELTRGGTVNIFG